MNAINVITKLIPFQSPFKKKKISTIRDSIYNSEHVQLMKKQYNENYPYKFLVISDLIDDDLLNSASENMKQNLVATMKETDIFKVYQTGDMANIDGLPEDEKTLLPDLIKVRDALYSKKFRSWVSEITGVGPLSGKKIDISCNAYGHTGHLLCHDDVIGSRRVSYILYLVDNSWNTKEKSDGGNLQLYPLDDESVLGIPAFAPSVSISPKWNQMVLFGVDPGRSFHDIQEVYNEEVPRLSLSGWFHKAQEDELTEWPDEVVQQGVKHDEEFMTKMQTVSTLAQLQGNGKNPSQCDNISIMGKFEEYKANETEDIDLSLWINDHYLQEEMQEKCQKKFCDEGGTLTLHKFLKKSVIKKICDEMKILDKKDKLGYREESDYFVGVRDNWAIVGPPHKQRFLWLGPKQVDEVYDELGSLLRKLQNMLRSHTFLHFLESITGDIITARRSSIRRFRPGLDYTLAKQPTWDCGNNNMILDAILCFVDDDDPYKEAAWHQDEVGGYVAYLSDSSHSKKKGDDADESRAENDAESKNDPAVYSMAENGTVISVSAINNSLTLALRDNENIVSFVKYVSAAAPGSRFDIYSEFVVDGNETPTDDEATETEEGRDNESSIHERCIEEDATKCAGGEEESMKAEESFSKNVDEDVSSKEEQVESSDPPSKKQKT